MQKMTLAASSFINFRSFRKASNSRIDDDNEIGSKEEERNLLKVNSFRTCFFTPEAKIAFTYLKKVFIEAPILHHFDLKY